MVSRKDSRGPARTVRDHLTAAEDDYDAAVRDNLHRGLETARLRALMSLAQSAARQATATEVANDLTALNTPGLLAQEQVTQLRDRVRTALGL